MSENSCYEDKGILIIKFADGIAFYHIIYIYNIYVNNSEILWGKYHAYAKEVIVWNDFPYYLRTLWPLLKVN
jgi:hypothetical protein